MQTQFSPDQPVAVVTGASSGIGKATAIRLAQLGWQIIGVGRNPERCAAAAADIRAVAGPSSTVEFLRADFDLMSEVKQIAEQITAKTSRLDALINNAGGIRDRQIVTGEGTEATFAANHLAPFLLTRELLPLLKATAAGKPGAARVIAVSSSGHRMAKGFNWRDPQMLHAGDQFVAGYAYCLAKLANILFTRELDRQLADTGVIALAMHPGVVASNFSSYGDQELQAHMAKADCDDPDKPAETLVWLATDATMSAQRGRYFFNLAEEEPAPQALDDDAARRLWQASESLIAQLGY